ncbi:MAG: hypothetical protein Q9208_008432 [Pyrenodesmia sp. 3 TL-2023]
MDRRILFPYVFAFSGAALLLVAFTRMRSLIIPGASDPLAFARSGSSSQPICKWVFSHYESSEYEQSWFGRIETAQNNICSVVAEREHADASTVIVNRTLDLKSLPASHQWKTYDTFPQTSLNSSIDIYMSRMHYNRTCYDSTSGNFTLAPGKGIQLIEPLWGMLRDPFDKWCGAEALHAEGFPETKTGQSKAHILPQGFAPYTYSLTDDVPSTEQPPSGGDLDSPVWRSHGIPPWHSSPRPLPNEQHSSQQPVLKAPKNIHLDLGSSYFGVWTKDGAAASGQWFYDTYHARGQPFDRFIAVEVETLDDTVAFEQVPSDLVGVYNLMNVPLSMEEGDKLNTIDMIKRVVDPEDFFVFKLDIDAAPIEEPIVRALLEDEPAEGGASGLIDELVCFIPPSPGTGCSFGWCGGLTD